MTKSGWLLRSVIVCMLAIAGERADAGNRKLVLIAGAPPSDYVGEPTNQTFYMALNMFKTNLDATTPGLTTTLVTNGWPTDTSIFNDADAVVLYSDGATANNHPLMVSNRLYTLALALNRGVSFSTFYKGCDIPDAQGGTEFLEWLGGYLNTNAVSPYSGGDWHCYQQAHWYGHFTNLPVHLITTGVPSYQLEDDWFVHFNFKASPPYTTPILRSTVLDHDAFTTNVVYQGTTQTVAWALERTNGGRGFAFGGGGDFNHQWNHPAGGGPNDSTNIGYNIHMVINALKWISKMDVVNSNQTAIPVGASWKYSDTGVTPGAGWTNLVFDDSGWSSGVAPLGYDTTLTKPLVTTVGYGGNSTNKFATTYFRKTFVVSATSTLTDAIINLNADDGAVAYVNGVEVGRVRMGTGPIGNTNLATATTGNLDEETQWASMQVPQGVLLAGSNVVAVEVHQSTVGSSDIRFDAYVTLQAGSTSNPPASTATNLIALGTSWQYFNTNSGPATNWTAKAFSDGSWPSGAAPLGYADPAIMTTLSFGGVDTNKWVTYYFRKHFVITNAASITGLVASFIADDGAVVYLNGAKVYTSTNIIEPVSDTSLTTVAEPEPYVPTQFTIAPSGVTTGDNVMAVEVHQATLGSSDLYFDMSLNTVGFATTNQVGGGQGASTNPPPAAPSNWTAYVDTAWHQDPAIFSGQGIDVAATTFTTNSPIGPVNGALKATTGQALPVSMSFSGNATVGMLARDLAIPGGTDVATVFAGHIGTNNAANWALGTVTMTLSGLTTTKQYTVAIWSSRGGTSAAYSNRWTDITIKSVDSFANNSSIGLTKLTSTMANDETRVVAVIDSGRIARYDQVRPGSDGTVVFDLTANGLAGTTETNGYLNAVMVAESDVTGGGNTNAVPDSWRIQYFGSTNAPNGGIFEDFDHDGFSNFAEWRAGTDPTNSGSRLEFTGGAPLTNQGAQVVFSWAGVTGKSYSLLSATNFITGWSTLQSGIPGASPLNVVTVNVANTKAFWRVKVE